LSVTQQSKGQGLGRGACSELQDKWDKGKAQVEELIEMIENDPNQLDRKRLEQEVRGFLQCVTQTCSGMTPCIVGFHLTVDDWREN
jgi:hypothetical protein